MTTITVIDTQDNSKEVELVAGLSLMELLRDAGFDEILAMCGGCCSCATCHVHISNADLPPVEEDEEMLLESAENYQAEKSRLSCQVQMVEPFAGMVVNLVELD